VTAFVHWLLRRRYYLLILAIAVTPLIPMLAVALIVLDTIRRGPYQGLVSAAIAATGVVALSAVVGSEPVVVGAVGALTMLSGAGLGAIVVTSHSLMLAFQASLLVCVAGAGSAVMVWPDASALIGPWVDSALTMLRQGGAAPEQLDAVNSIRGVFFGLAAAAVFVQAFAAVILGYWWASLAGLASLLGQQFRNLRLGRILGVPATLIMAASLFFDAPLIQNLFPLALFGFCFQGLAVTHAWAHAKRWNPALLLVMYLLLVSPLTVIIILALGSMGLTDNWINLRAPLRTVS
jgi:hypothetical protein